MSEAESGSAQRQQLEGEFVLAMRRTGLVSQLLSQAADSTDRIAALIQSATSGSSSENH